jgi:hypothetical protein
VRKVKVRPERDRLVFEVLHALAGKTPKEISERCFVSPTTIRKWRTPLDQGGTRYPQAITLAAAAATVGLKLSLVPIDAPTRRERAKETA